jgi:hypothetical protein
MLTNRWDQIQCFNTVAIKAGIRQHHPCSSSAIAYTISASLPPQRAQVSHIVARTPSRLPGQDELRHRSNRICAPPIDSTTDLCKTSWPDQAKTQCYPRRWSLLRHRSHPAIGFSSCQSPVFAASCKSSSCQCLLRSNFIPLYPILYPSLTVFDRRASYKY